VCPASGADRHTGTNDGNGGTGYDSGDDRDLALSTVEMAMVDDNREKELSNLNISVANLLMYNVPLFFISHRMNLG